MDIQSGDFLVVGAKSYPIRSCEIWATDSMNTRGFRRMCTVSASTKRTRRGEPSVVLSSVRCTPLDPIDAELRKRLALETPNTLLQTFVADGEGFLRLALEDLKQ